MTKKKRIILLVGRSVVCILLVGCTAFSVYQLRQTQTRGEYSDVCGRISPAAKMWILDEFGDCQTVEELLQRLDTFAVENFEYDGDISRGMYIILQTFDMDAFLFGKERFTHLCFGFACWVKNCVVVWADEKGIDVEAFVIDATIHDNQKGHSFNIFRYQNKTYSLDVTIDNSRAKKGKQPIGLECWGDVSFETVAEKLDVTIDIWR